MLGEILECGLVLADIFERLSGFRPTYLSGIADLEETGTSIENCGACVSRSSLRGGLDNGNLYRWEARPYWEGRWAQRQGRQSHATGKDGVY